MPCLGSDNPSTRAAELSWGVLVVIGTGHVATAGAAGKTRCSAQIAAELRFGQAAAPVFGPAQAQRLRLLRQSTTRAAMGATRWIGLGLLCGSPLLVGCGGLSSYTGKVYGVTEINQARLTGGEHVVEGYVIQVHRCPPCPPGAQCALCPREHIVVADRPGELQGWARDRPDWLVLGPPEEPLVEQRHYRLRVLLTEPNEADGWPRVAGWVLEAVSVDD